MTRKIGKNARLRRLLAVAVGSLGVLPAYFAIDLFVRYRDHFDRDPSLTKIILVCSVLAAAFFASAMWVFFRTGHIGLEIDIAPGRVDFDLHTVFGGYRHYDIDWRDVEHIVVHDIPHGGESLRFMAHDASRPWHKRDLPLKLSQTRWGALLPSLTDSAREAGFELERTKRLMLFIFDREVWTVRPSA